MKNEIFEKIRTINPDCIMDKTIDEIIEEKMERIETEAEKMGLTVSAYVRMIVLERAEAEGKVIKS